MSKWTQEERDKAMQDIAREFDIHYPYHNEVELACQRNSLLEALKFFMEDPRFQIQVGGNPHAVDKMLEQVRAAISKVLSHQTNKET